MQVSVKAWYKIKGRLKMGIVCYEKNRDQLEGCSDSSNLFVVYTLKLVLGFYLRSVASYSACP
jgi:hypothetical protein